MTLPSTPYSGSTGWRWSFASSKDLEAFSDKTRLVYEKWSKEIGVDLRPPDREDCGELYQI